MPGRDAHKWSLEMTGVPALSADGARVLTVVEYDSDKRGYPNDTFYVRRVRDDKVVEQLMGFDAHELGTNDDSPARAAVERRAAALHALLTRERWVPMPAATPSGTNVFVLEDYRFDLGAKRATLTRKGAPVATFDASGWKAKDIPPDSMSSTSCVFTAELAQVHIEVKARVLAVSVRQRIRNESETVGCGSPDVTHVLAWQESPPR